MTTATVDTQNKDDAKKFANLIGPMDPKLDREVREQLITARVGMLLRLRCCGPRGRYSPRLAKSP